MKVLVIGGVAGGASAAARVRRLDASAEVVVLDRGDYVSYSNCSLPYYLSGTVESDEDLIMMWPENFRASHDIEVRVRNEALAIDRERKCVTVRDLNSGDCYEENYDKLVLAPGAAPIMPASIQGIDRPNVFSLRTVNDAVRIREAIRADRDGAHVTVVGGGFIGIEMTENLIEAGAKVTLVEGLDQILQPYDYDMVQTLQKELQDHGVSVHLSTTLKEIGETSVIVESGGKDFAIDTEYVVMAIGVTPETKLAKASGLEIGQTGGIRVDENYQTNDPDIYAVGDVIEVTNLLTGLQQRLPLAGPAQKQARAAADHICGVQSRKGRSAGRVIGSSCIRVFGLNAASTGLNEKSAAAAGIDFDSVMIFPSDRVGIMPGANYMQFKLLFEKGTGRVLGAQAIGTGDTVMRVNVVATLISMGGKVEDLKDLELCYAPLYSTAKDVVNMAALVAGNVLDGSIRQVHVSDARKLVEEGAMIIDVRSPEEYEEGHLNGSVNIPLGQIRQRLDEIPKDVPVYLHCRSSQRSYYALCALRGRGYENVMNISGSFLGFSLYEYFNDVTGDRRPIVTRYNFD